MPDAATQSLIEAAIQGIIEQTIESLPHAPNASPEAIQQQRDTARGLLNGLAPRTALDAFTASHIVVMFHVAATCFQLASAPGLPEALMLRFMAQGNAASRMHVQLSRDYAKSHGANLASPDMAAMLAPEAMLAAPPYQFDPMPSETLPAAAPPFDLPAPQPPATPADMWDKILRQRAAAGVTNGFRQPAKQRRAA